MRRGTVIALIKVVGENLPVVVARELVRVVEDVLVEVQAFVSVLLVDVGEVRFPGYFGGFLRE